MTTEARVSVLWDPLKEANLQTVFVHGCICVVCERSKTCVILFFLMHETLNTMCFMERRGSIFPFEFPVFLFDGPRKLVCSLEVHGYSLWWKCKFKELILISKTGGYVNIWNQIYTELLFLIWGWSKFLNTSFKLKFFLVFLSVIFIKLFQKLSPFCSPLFLQVMYAFSSWSQNV